MTEDKAEKLSNWWMNHLDEIYLTALVVVCISWMFAITTLLLEVLIAITVLLLEVLTEG